MSSLAFWAAFADQILVDQGFQYLAARLSGFGRIQLVQFVQARHRTIQFRFSDDCAIHLCNYSVLDDCFWLLAG